MLYESQKKWSVLNKNLSAWRLSCSIYPQIQLHNSSHRPGAHGLDTWICLLYVMEIEVKKLD